MTYQRCTRCVMDSTDPEIMFDDKGECNHCKNAEIAIAKEVISDPIQKQRAFDAIIDKIKSEGKGKEYDCLIGVSGGVDSTYVAYKVKKLGLRPLAVHIDNGWNSELSVSNIEKALKTLNIDLYTCVLDWDEFKSLQMAFLRASVPDLEIPTDHAINSVLRSMTTKHNIKYMIFGSNINTESILPRRWSHGHQDWGYIQAINKRFGGKELKSFPHLSFWKKIYYRITNNLEIINLLDYLDYSKSGAIEILQKELNWQYYGGKHYESVYTRFVQGYILPRKFNYDKRKAHLSSLIVSGEISRDEALQELEKPIYPPDLLEEDLRFVISKFEITETEFNRLMELPNKEFEDYPSYERSIKYKLIRSMYGFYKEFFKRT